VKFGVRTKGSRQRPDLRNTPVRRAGKCRDGRITYDMIPDRAPKNGHNKEFGECGKHLREATMQEDLEVTLFNYLIVNSLKSLCFTAIPPFRLEAAVLLIKFFVVMYFSVCRQVRYV